MQRSARGTGVALMFKSQFWLIYKHSISHVCMAMLGLPRMQRQLQCLCRRLGWSTMGVSNGMTALLARLCHEASFDMSTLVMPTLCISREQALNDAFAALKVAKCAFLATFYHSQRPFDFPDGAMAADFGNVQGFVKAITVCALPMNRHTALPELWKVDTWYQIPKTRAHEVRLRTNRRWQLVRHLLRCESRLPALLVAPELPSHGTVKFTTLY